MNVRDSVYSVHQKTPKYLKTLWCCHANKSRVIPSESHTPCVVVLMYVLIRGCVEINWNILLLELNMKFVQNMYVTMCT